jgi:hypothetical protein
MRGLWPQTYQNESGSRTEGQTAYTATKRYQNPLTVLAEKTRGHKGVTALLLSYQQHQ